MPYYLCSSGASEREATICTSWKLAKAQSQGVKGGWAKRFETRAEAEAALSELKSHRVAAETPGLSDIYVDGSAVLGEWSACAVFFGEGDPRNAVRVLPPPHTSPRAELEAVLLALVQGASEARVWSDSAYVCQASESGWASPAHPQLAAMIGKLCRTRRVFVRKVAGHSGDPGNTAVDAMLSAIRSQRGLRAADLERP